MSDIVERLLDGGQDLCKDGPVWPGDVMLEAADEIARLRKERDEAVKVLSDLCRMSETGGGARTGSARALLARIKEAKGDEG